MGQKPESKIEKFFNEGQRFTQELMKENERLRFASEGQRRTIDEFRNKQQNELPKLKERIGFLTEENVLLRTELNELKNQFDQIEQSNTDFTERYMHVEKQNASLLNLYVASQRLHSTLDFGLVIQVVKELIVNLIGSESFEISLYDKSAERLVVLANLGTKNKVRCSIPITNRIHEVIETGILYVSSSTSPDSADMAACIPLKFNNEVMGMIIIRRLLSQKAGIEGIDHELFDLLGEHAASAIFASHLYSKQRESTFVPPGWSTQIDSMTTEALQIDESDFEPSVVW